MIEDQRMKLLVQIERKRQNLYQTYHKNMKYEKLISISQELDQLLNQLRTTNCNKSISIIIKLQIRTEIVRMIGVGNYRSSFIISQSEHDGWSDLQLTGF